MVSIDITPFYIYIKIYSVTGSFVGLGFVSLSTFFLFFFFFFVCVRIERHESRQTHTETFHLFLFLLLFLIWQTNRDGQTIPQTRIVWLGPNNSIVFRLKKFFSLSLSLFTCMCWKTQLRGDGVNYPVPHSTRNMVQTNQKKIKMGMGCLSKKDAIPTADKRTHTYKSDQERKEIYNTHSKTCNNMINSQQQLATIERERELSFTSIYTFL